MYNPPDPGNGMLANDLEFIEIYNASDTQLDTPNWSLRGGVDFDFPTAYGFPVPDDIPGRITLDPHEALLLVGFDPAKQPETRRQFREYYAIDKSVQIAGPFTGNIDNATDTVRLVRPDYPPNWEPHHFPNVVEDEVTYSDSDRWPASADGQGDTLQRKRIDLWGNDSTSWSAKRRHLARST